MMKRVGIRPSNIELQRPKEDSNAV
jgi:hypothetical protein